ncbi:hypothetical protein PoB_001850800 [Plakobranchus ocellatus]|uniref:Uncharacterized protein n=1 Tax=Plakobranchus ocellatus TaxID=259542 RepID=A0AAV3ZC67_9GAST|nr:hypothetical protein PoB_001850800 [Plakobranchus ocellatus]
MRISEVTAAEVSVLKGCKTLETKSVTCVPKGCILFITGKGVGVLKRFNRFHLSHLEAEIEDLRLSTALRPRFALTGIAGNDLHRGNSMAGN